MTHGMPWIIVTREEGFPSSCCPPTCISRWSRIKSIEKKMPVLFIGYTCVSLICFDFQLFHYDRWTLTRKYLPLHLRTLSCGVNGSRDLTVQLFFCDVDNFNNSLRSQNVGRQISFSTCRVSGLRKRGGEWISMREWNRGGHDFEWNVPRRIEYVCAYVLSYIRDRMQAWIISLNFAQANYTLFSPLAALHRNALGRNAFADGSMYLKMM